jgi:Kef-type K+ transport system membrane component KefB
MPHAASGSFFTLDKVRGMSPDAVTAIVIADIGLVLALSSLLGTAARRLGQPAVIGQILTGIALGPSLLGRLPGHLTSHLFPAAALPYLSVLAQVGVVVFMFLVAYEIDFRTIGGHTRPVVLVALSALLVPMTLGSGSAVLFRGWFMAPGQPSGHSFVLFVGVAVSVTALPVLASIVRERGLADTTAGVVATSAAGGMDVMAWLALAAAIAGSAHSTRRPLLVTALLICCWTAAMLLIVRPALRRWFDRPAAILAQQVTVAAVLTMANAYVTTLLGLHPVFGGFLAGLTMARVGGRGPDPDVLRSMESASNLLLPLFFVNTGLLLNIGSLRAADLGLLALIVAIACAGKLAPGYAASRLSGLTREQAATVAVLVNTRGLTELIALNTGLQAGIIGRRLFTVFVLMALLTTMATGPLLTLIGRRSADRLPAQAVQPDKAYE